MADWQDVTNARGAADLALSDVDALGSAIEDGRGDGSLGQLLGDRAVALELRALGLTIDYALTTLAGAIGHA